MIAACVPSGLHHLRDRPIGPDPDGKHLKSFARQTTDAVARFVSRLARPERDNKPLKIVSGQAARKVALRGGEPFVNFGTVASRRASP
jgi:hypothetical protein